MHPSPFIISNDEPNGIASVQDWLRFNDLDYQMKSFWKEEIHNYNLDVEISNSIVVWNPTIFRQFLSNEQNVKNLLDFSTRGNQLWVIGTDLGVMLIEPIHQEQIQILDDAVGSHTIQLFLDAEPDKNCYINHLQNIKLVYIRYNFLMQSLPRIQATSSNKQCPTHDFLFLTVKKSNRPHREALWQQLQKRQHLTDRGIIIYKPKLYPPWVGLVNHDNPRNEQHASMDLYLNSYVEVIAETCYKDLYFTTEKTTKSIVTRTPFLVMSTPGYLYYLQRLGFQTFGSLIDESYDQADDMHDRADRIINVLDHIVTNGAKEFYQACQPILDHNFNRLCEISGSWPSNFDQTMWDAFGEYNYTTK